MEALALALTLAGGPAWDAAPPRAPVPPPPAQAQPALPAPAPAPAKDPWVRLLERLRKDGTFTPRQGREGARYALALPKEGVPGVERRATLRGFTDAQGTFQPLLVVLEREDWTREADGRTVCDRWTFTLAVDGKLLTPMRVVFTYAADGRVLAAKLETLAKDDPRVPYLLQQLIARLAGQQP